MSIRANPTAIGLFTIGAVVLVVIGIATLASGAWFSKWSSFVSYFDESVNGLEVGAPVKFQGVPVGRVTELLIQIELADKTFQVPVQFEIELSRLTSQTGTFVDLTDPGVLRRQIANGLRAQLQMESLVTGMLYVELSYRADAEPPTLEPGQTVFPEIPTTQSLLAAFGTQAGSMVGDVLKILFRVNEMLESVDVVELNASVVASAQALERLADSPDIRAAFREVPVMSAQFNQTMAEMQLLAERLGSAVEPARANLDSTSAELIAALRTVRQGLEQMQGFFTTDSGIGYQMQEALAGLKDAADAMQILAFSLERNPDMLLRGKKPTLEH
jgi:paraquat-inducible protein B